MSLMKKEYREPDGIASDPAERLREQKKILREALSAILGMRVSPLVIETAVAALESTQRSY